MGNPKMLLAYTLGTIIVVGAIVSLATNSWWFLLIALAAHFIASGFVLAFTMKRVNQGDKPDPVAEAHLEAGDEQKGNGGLTKSGRYGDREVIH